MTKAAVLNRAKSLGVAVVWSTSAHEWVFPGKNYATPSNDDAYDYIDFLGGVS